MRVREKCGVLSILEFDPAFSRFLVELEMCSEISVVLEFDPA